MVDLNREYLLKNYEEDILELNDINLCNSRIKIIDLSAFKGLSKLERLFLTNNEIEEINQKSFESL